MAWLLQGIKSTIARQKRCFCRAIRAEIAHLGRVVNASRSKSHLCAYFFGEVLRRAVAFD
jgi:hypothetical protein